MSVRKPPKKRTIKEILNFENSSSDDDDGSVEVLMVTNSTPMPSRGPLSVRSATTINSTTTTTTILSTSDESASPPSFPNAEMQLSTYSPLSPRCSPAFGTQLTQPKDMVVAADTILNNTMSNKSEEPKASHNKNNRTTRVPATTTPCDSLANVVVVTKEPAALVLPPPQPTTDTISEPLRLTKVSSRPKKSTKSTSFEQEQEQTHVEEVIRQTGRSRKKNGKVGSKKNKTDATDSTGSSHCSVLRDTLDVGGYVDDQSYPTPSEVPKSNSSVVRTRDHSRKADLPESSTILKLNSSSLQKKESATIGASENTVDLMDSQRNGKPQLLDTARGDAESRKDSATLVEHQSTLTNSTSNTDVKNPASTTDLVKSKDNQYSSTKQKKMTFQDQVLNHMTISFKPFTLKSLAAELKTTETALEYVMLSLKDKNLIIRKDFESGKGKSKTLFWANHGVKSKEVTITLASPNEIAAAKRKLSEQQTHYVSLMKKFGEVSESPSNDELAAQFETEQHELEMLRERLRATKERIKLAKSSSTQPKPLQTSGMMKSTTQLAKESCPIRLKMRIANMRDEWKKRKEKCMDFVENLADGMDKKPKDIIKLLDLETDEAVGVNLSSKSNNRDLLKR